MSFLGGVDPDTGIVVDGECESRGSSVEGKVFCFPYGRGSTVGSYVMYQLRLNGKAPAAIVNSSAEPIVATGAIIAEIPMVDCVDTGILRTGDEIVLDADAGKMEVLNVVDKHVVTNIIRSGGKVLLLRRSDKVGSYRGLWAGVSGFIEKGEGDEDAARRELREEIGLGNPKFVRRLEPMMFRDGDTVWCVHPFLVDVKDFAVTTDWEHQGYEWVAPREVAKYPTVPGLQQVIWKLLDL